MKTMRSGHLVWLPATLAVALMFLTGCAEWNDNPAPGMKVNLSFQGAEPNPNGLIDEPDGTEEVLSIIVGAVVISRATPWQTSEADDLTQAEEDELADDAIQSADFLTIEDLPFNGDSISFLIPPDTSGNWQLIAVGSRDNIDVLEDFDGNDDAPIWYGFSDGVFLNGLVVPGAEIAVQLAPACNQTPPPTGACP